MAAETHAAFLRAVNVGGTGKLAMTDLRALTESIGGIRPETCLASGNVVFDHADAAATVQDRLERALSDHAGKPVGVVLRDAPALAAILAALPFADAAPNRVLVLLTDAPLTDDPQARCRNRTTEVVRPGPGALFIHYPDGIGRSRLSHPAMASGTARNLNTLRRVHAMTLNRPAAK